MGRKRQVLTKEKERKLIKYIKKYWTNPEICSAAFAGNHSFETFFK